MLFLLFPCCEILCIWLKNGPSFFFPGDFILALFGVLKFHFHYTPAKANHPISNKMWWLQFLWQTLQKTIFFSILFFHCFPFRDMWLFPMPVFFLIVANGASNEENCLLIWIGAAIIKSIGMAVSTASCSCCCKESGKRIFVRCATPHLHFRRIPIAS